MAEGAGGWTATRRGFLRAAAGGLAALALPKGAAVARAGPTPLAPFLTFHSRPDLSPPSLAVTAATDTVPGYVFVSAFTGTTHGTALILDNAGEPIWVHPSALLLMNFRAQTYRGRPVLTWWEGSAPGGFFSGHCVIADQSYRVLARFAAVDYRPEVHEFVITSRDSALVSINNFVDMDLTAYGGPAAGTVVEGVIQELDIATGKKLFEWHSLDHVGLDETAFPASAVWDYFHLNSIGVDVDGNLIASARYPSTVYKIDRRTGAVLWRLGGTKSDFALEPGATFAFQHDARTHPGDLVSVFDDAAYSPQSAIEPVSRALVLQLDTTAMTATAVAEHQNPHGSLTLAMGNAQRLGDGGYFVGWGTISEVSEFGPDGALRFDATFPSGYMTYRGFRQPWVGLPATRPSVAAVSGSGGSIDVYASWNGATEVAAWQIQGGPRAGALRTLRTVARSGFETQATLALPETYVAAVALDSRGHTLGSSPAIRV